MPRRYIVHSAVVLMVALSAIRLPAPVSVTLGASGGAVRPTPRIIEWTEPEDLPRSIASDRKGPVPTPLPTPVPIDPDREPLAAPTNSPAPVAIPSARPASELPDTTKAALQWPVHGTITTYYSAAHPAIDIGAPCGTPVLAPASGTIVWAGWKNNGGGYVVDIETAVGLVSLNHLSGIATTGWVSAGQVVGYVGATGIATGCHLHLALLIDGAWRNPLLWL